MTPEVTRLEEPLSTVPLDPLLSLTQWGSGSWGWEAKCRPLIKVGSQAELISQGYRESNREVPLSFKLPTSATLLFTPELSEPERCDHGLAG